LKVEDLAHRIDAVIARRATRLIAIDGWGGSGKSRLASELEKRLPSVAVVHTDDFAGPNQPGWDWQRFSREVLDPLLADRPARFQRYDWNRDQLGEWQQVPTGGTVIVEGISSSRQELGQVWDLVIWVECSRELRLRRGVERDGEALRWKWETVWMPEEEAYVRTQHPIGRANIVVDGSDVHFYESGGLPGADGIKA
jgi:uridine kinase